MNIKRAIRLFALGLLWLTAAEASAQIAPKAQAILDRYKQVTGTDKPMPDTVVSERIILKGSKPSCYRVEMNVAKLSVLIVADGQTS